MRFHLTWQALRFGSDEKGLWLEATDGGVPVYGFLDVETLDKFGRQVQPGKHRITRNGSLRV